MVEIGLSLDPATTIVAQARRVDRRHQREHYCRRCREFPYPRGFDPTTGLCWWCSFPRLLAKDEA